MIQHIFKIIGNQWKNNLWIVLELFIAITLIWYIVDYFSIMYITSRTPVGFDIKDTYIINVANYQSDNPNYIAYEKDSEEPALNYLRIIERIKNYPDIIGVSVGEWHFPYCRSNSTDRYRRDSLKTNAQILFITPAYFDVFKVAPYGGGNPDQLGEAFQKGIIISYTMKEKLFPDTQGTGQIILNDDSTESYKIAAISNPIKDYIFRRPGNYIYLPFKEQTLMGKDEQTINQETEICIRSHPDSKNKDFALSLKKEMQTQLNIGNYYLAGVTPISKLRDERFRAYGVYENTQHRTGFTLFFLFNVFLGVIGTCWLRVKKRKEEIGVRIAMGSSKQNIMKQMILESIMLLFIATVPAVIIWINLLYLDILPTKDADLNLQRFLLNTFFTLCPLVLVILLATWYPARYSANIQPAEALHYE